MKIFSMFTHVNIRAIGAGLFALILLGVAETSHAEEHKGPPPAVVEVDKATTARLAPARWVPGSVIYRGLAAVNVGGVVISLIFSLLLLPSLMRLAFARRVQKAQIAPPRGRKPRLVEVKNKVEAA